MARFLKDIIALAYVLQRVFENHAFAPGGIVAAGVLTTLVSLDLVSGLHAYLVVEDLASRFEQKVQHVFSEIKKKRHRLKKRKDNDERA